MTVRVVRCGEPASIRHVMKFGVKDSHKLAEIRCPARRLFRCGHEGGMMVHRLEERDLNAVSGVADAEGAIAEAARSACKRSRMPLCDGPARNCRQAVRRGASD